MRSTNVLRQVVAIVALGSALAAIEASAATKEKEVAAPAEASASAVRLQGTATQALKVTPKVNPKGAPTTAGKINSTGSGNQYPVGTLPLPPKPKKDPELQAPIANKAVQP